MPGSTSTSNCDLAHRPRRRTQGLPAHGRFTRDDAAVSEVVGYVLTFGVLAVVLTVSLVGFNAAQEDTEERVVALRAGSAAQRVAASVVEAGLLAEGSNSFTYERTLSLPHDLEGHDYTITLESDAVIVQVQGYEWQHQEPIFHVGSTLPVCTPSPPTVETSVPGGPLRIIAERPSPGCVRLEEAP